MEAAGPFWHPCAMGERSGRAFGATRVRRLAFLAAALLAVAACAAGVSPSPPPGPPSGGPLTILEPPAGATVASSALIVRGRAPAGAEVTRDIPLATDVRTTARADGSWELAVNLVPGENELVFRIDNDRSTDVRLVLVYDPNLAGASPSPGASVGASPTATATPTPSGSATPSPSLTPELLAGPTGPTQPATVVDVVDGDTIKVELAGQVYTVRYIGMDTPETVKPGSPVEWMGPEASAANVRLVESREVVLEKDVSETDRYGRLLRHVWLREDNGWLLAGLELVRLGYAQVYTYPPDVKYADLFLAAEREAREAGRGLWGATPSPSGGATSGPTAGSTEPAGCDPAYPGVCIPPPPPDLDCADIPYRRFTVLAPDPHRFDGDHDGIGCEG